MLYYGLRLQVVACGLVGVHSKGVGAGTKDLVHNNFNISNGEARLRIKRVQ